MSHQRMQINATIRYHFTTITTALIQKTVTSTDEEWRDYPSSLHARMGNGAAALQTVWQFLRRLNTESPHDPEFLFPGTDPREMEMCHPESWYTHVHGSITVTAKKWEHSRCPSTEEWINKMWYNPYDGMLFVNKKE